jgi:hypothetical protein
MDLRLCAQWYPDEDICHAKTANKPAWVKTQRKIRRLYLEGGISGDETCFTLTMLQSIRTVRHPKGMRPEDLYKNRGGRTSTMCQFIADMPLNSFREKGNGKAPTVSSSSNFQVNNQGLIIKSPA